jgi:hypothetical protein
MTHDNSYGDCIICEECIDDMDYPEDSWYVSADLYSTYRRIDDGPTGPMCLYCVESFDSYSDTLVVTFPDGLKAKYEYDDGIMFDHSIYTRDFVEPGDMPAGVFEAAVDIMAGSRWVSTDAWRGYSTTPGSAGDWVRVKNSWHSTMERTDVSDLINALSNGEAGLDFPVMVVYAKTSNVMSMGIEIYAPEEHVEDINALFDNASARLAGGRF